MHFRPHKRRGNFNGRPQPIEIYHRLLELAATWLGLKHVYLACESPEYVEVFRRRHPSLRFHSMEDLGLFPSGDVHHLHKDVGQLTAENWYVGEDRDEALAMLANTYLLGSCQYFIGSVSSNLGRAARELMAFAKVCIRCICMYV